MKRSSIQPRELRNMVNLYTARNKFAGNQEVLVANRCSKNQNPLKKGNASTTVAQTGHGRRMEQQMIGEHELQHKGERSIQESENGLSDATKGDDFMLYLQNYGDLLKKQLHQGPSHVTQGRQSDMTSQSYRPEETNVDSLKFGFLQDSTWALNDEEPYLSDMQREEVTHIRDTNTESHMEEDGVSIWRTNTGKRILRPQAINLPKENPGVMNKKIGAQPGEDLHLYDLFQEATSDVQPREDRSFQHDEHDFTTYTIPADFQQEEHDFTMDTQHEHSVGSDDFGLREINIRKRPLRLQTIHSQSHQDANPNHVMEGANINHGC